jgi:hypothetical protein
VLFNGVFKLLADKYLWYTDLTRDEIYTLSDAAVTALENVDKDVHILFCDDPDNLEEDYYSKMVYKTALGLAEKNDYIHVDTLNDNIIYPDPEAYNNPEVIVSENGDVTTVFPTEYLVRELHGELLKQVVLADTMWYKIDAKGKFQLIRKHNTPHTPESVMNEYFR